MFSGAELNSWFAELGLFAARVYFGWIICLAGISKFPTANWFQGQVADLGFPAPSLMAFLATASEFVGGILLILGLCTRPAAFLAAVTMGVAAFGFHKNGLGEMHIAQMFFWAFVLFTFVGGGRLSLDAFFRASHDSNPQSSSKQSSYAPALLLIPLLLLALAGWYEMQPVTPPPDPAEDIQQISVAGSFNRWNPDNNLMNQDNETAWSTQIEVAEAGEIEFKFVINQDWNTNLGETDQTEKGFPAEGVAELDDGKNSTGNIKAYLPSPGAYSVTFDTDTHAYRVLKKSD